MTLATRHNITTYIRDALPGVLEVSVFENRERRHVSIVVYVHNTTYAQRMRLVEQLKFLMPVGIGVSVEFMPARLNSVWVAVVLVAVAVVVAIALWGRP